MSETVRKVFKTRIRGSIDDAWREITKTGEVQGVMFNSVLDSTLEVGAPIRLRTPNRKYTGIIGEVVAFDPPHRYAHTFSFTSYPDEPGCTVIHELEDLGDGEIEYRMICEDMVVDTRTTKQMAQGADLILANLKSVVETGKLPFKTRILYAMFALTTPFTPSRMKSENYP